ncbi:hypothetical protein AB0P12_16455 [Streptomyces subrutilus]|uniref:hypothetical protein n=1 Tax=Streptomyces subrutilus TaxID=36818 RepID=UPI00341294CD
MNGECAFCRRGARPRTRREFQEALLDPCRPVTGAAALEGRLEAVGHPGAVYPRRTARLERPARLLRGPAPLAAGGAGSAGWAGVREQIAAGTDPGSAASRGLPGPHTRAGGGGGAGLRPRPGAPRVVAAAAPRRTPPAGRPAGARGRGRTGGRQRAPRTLLPTLRGTLDPGEHWPVTACVAGTEAGGEQRFAQGPDAAAVARAAELAALPDPVRTGPAGARSAP